MFEQFDDDNSGDVDRDEIEQLCDSLGVSLEPEMLEVL